MKKEIMTRAFVILGLSTLYSCGGAKAGVGGTDSELEVDTRGRSINDYVLEPAGDRITYTIDISTPEGKQKLYKLSLNDAQRLAQTEAAYKYNCDRLIDPHFTYLKKGKRILRVTVMGRPGKYRLKE